MLIQFCTVRMRPELIGPYFWPWRMKRGDWYAHAFGRQLHLTWRLSR